MQSRKALSDEEREQYREKLRQNMKEGTFGERGEFFVALQVFFTALVFVGPAFEESVQGPLGIVAGLALCATGLGLGYAGSMDLGSSMTPWPKPVSDNELQTTGSFGVARHPIYGGSILLGLGLSLLSHSFERLLFTIVLYIVMDLKAAKEEEWLAQVHPGYKEYQQHVPKLLPRDAIKVIELAKDIIKSKTA